MPPKKAWQCTDVQREDWLPDEETWVLRVNKISGSHASHRMGTKLWVQLGIATKLVFCISHLECLGTSGVDCKWHVAVLNASRPATGQSVQSVGLVASCDDASDCASMAFNGQLPRALIPGDGLFGANWNAYVDFRVRIRCSDRGSQ